MSADPQDLGRLRDIVAYGNRVQAMMAGLTPEVFIADTRTFFAVCYGIQVVGEATWKVSDALKRTHPTIPWPLVAGMRHRPVHDYGRTDETIVYQVATIHLPCFIEQIQTILTELTADQQPPST